MVIELYNVVDVTPGKFSARAGLTYRRYNEGVHAFDSPGAAKRHCTAAANRHPSRRFAILCTRISESGVVESEWITDVTFVVPAKEEAA